MSENITLTVDTSEFGHIPEGTTLEVVRDSTNQFSGKRVLTVRPDCKIPNRIEGSTLQLFRLPDMSEWREVLVGMGRENESVTFKG